MLLRVHRILRQNKTSGPGVRFCLWVQGCSKHCKGCMAKETWSFSDGSLIETEEVFQDIISTPGIEGVTILGGEPFEQVNALYELAKKIKTTDLSLVIFTGNTLDKLKAKDEANIDQLLKITDLLVDGSFDEDQFDLSRPWVGSSNQKYNFLTKRYNMKDLEGVKNKMEVRISSDGKTLINGMGDFKNVKNIFA